MRVNNLSEQIRAVIVTKDKVADKLLFWSFCCMFFFIPVATSPAVIAGALSLAIWVFSGKFVKDRQKWLKEEWCMPVVLFMLLPWAGLLWTEDFATGLDLASKSYYWLYAFAIASLSLHNYQKTLIISYLSGLSLSAGISILQYIGLVPMPKGYPAGFMGYINYSLLLVFGLLILSFYYQKVKNRKYKILLLFLMAIYLFNLSINRGRIGYLAFVILSPWMLYNILGRKHFLKIASGMLVMVVILSLSPVVRDRTKHALDDVKAYYQQGKILTSIGARLYMWDRAIKIFLKHPVIGAGTGIKYNLVEPGLSLFFVHPHNSFLYIASSYGIVGLSLFLWLLIVFIKKGWQARETVEGFSVLSFGAVLLIGSLTDTQILSLATAKMFALLMGIRNGITGWQDFQ